MVWRRLDRKPTPKPRFVVEADRLALVALPFSSADEFADEFADAVETGRIGQLLEPHEYWALPLPDVLWHSSLVRIAAGTFESGRRKIRNQWMDRSRRPTARAIRPATCTRAGT